MCKLRVHAEQGFSRVNYATCVSTASYILQASLLLVDNISPSALHACKEQEHNGVDVNAACQCVSRLYDKHAALQLSEEEVKDSSSKGSKFHFSVTQS